MASLHDLTVGQDMEFKRILAKAGFDAEMILDIIKKPELADRMRFALDQASGIYVNSNLFFTPLEAQFDEVRAWNKRYGLGFVDEDFDKAEKEACELPTDKLTTVTLVPYLSDCVRTFIFLKARVFEKQERFYEDEKCGKPTVKTLRLYRGIEHRPGLRVETIDLAANWNKRKGSQPEYVRGSESPHASILASAALHPKWVKAMDGRHVPYVWLSGYEVAITGNDWGVPNIYFDQGTGLVKLNAEQRYNRDEYCAVPALRK